MKKSKEFRRIPGYDQYAVSKDGVVKSVVRDIVLSQYLLDGYLIVDTFRGSKTETLPVHRAVALAWVENPNPEKFTVVNHKDGDRTNNWYENLEWTDYSGNNYHAINSGLRNDNIPCRIRDFETGEITEFSSMAQAAVAMGLRACEPYSILRPKMFGKLVADKYELRFKDEPTPWFYENRTERVKPSRYMVIVTEEDGSSREIFSTRALLKEYQLYDSPMKSIPELAKFGNQKYPNKEFKVLDSYSGDLYRVTRQTKESRKLPVLARNPDGDMHFDSLTQCAKHFGVDRSVIHNRLDKQIDLDGWTFTRNIAPSVLDG